MVYLVYWQHINETFIAHTHTHRAPTKLPFRYTFLCSLLFYLKYPSSSFIQPPASSVAVTLSTLSHGPRGSFAQALGLHWIGEVRADTLFSTSSMLHYSNYHRKSYITWGPHGICCSSETTSPIVFLFSSPFFHSLQRINQHSPSSMPLYAALKGQSNAGVIGGPGKSRAI